ncbi:MAG TPA: hypothetical protein VLB09_07735 [Nitrospiria bacterium]|nr:hypothetical protein [Nitrospiria bacterium]
MKPTKKKGKFPRANFRKGETEWTRFKAIHPVETALSPIFVDEADFCPDDGEITVSGVDLDTGEVIPPEVIIFDGTCNSVPCLPGV